MKLRRYIRIVFYTNNSAAINLLFFKIVAFHALFYTESIVFRNKCNSLCSIYRESSFPKQALFFYPILLGKRNYGKKDGC